MLEILGIILLCNVNKANAVRRGRKPGPFAWLTIGLWFGLEVLGFIIGRIALQNDLLAYLPALVMALIGGLISYLAAKNCKPGDYVDPAVAMNQSFAINNEALDAPAQITVVRDSSAVGALASWNFTLNGQPIGELGNGQFLNAVTAQKKNVLTAKDSLGTEIAPYAFEVAPGTAAEIHFKANRFLPELSSGILSTIPASDGAPAQAVSAPYTQNTATAYAPAAFCTNCGAKLEPGSTFCTDCGAKRNVSSQADNGAYLAQTVPALSANNLRAVTAALFLFIGWIISLLIHAVFKRPVALQYAPSVPSLAAFAILGIGIYLITQKELKWKLAGGGLGLFSTLLLYIGTLANYTRSEFGIINFRMVFLTFSLRLNNLFEYVIECGTAIILAVIFSYVFRNREQKSKTLFTALIAAAGSFLFDFVYYVLIRLAGNRFINILSLIIDIVFTALIIFVSAYAAGNLCTIPTAKIELRGWSKVWCWLCTVGLGLSIIGIIIVAATAGKMRGDPIMIYSSQLVLSIAALVGFILLLAKKRAGWYFILFASLIVLCGQFHNSLIMSLNRYPQFYTLLASSVLGAATPIITRASINSAWNDTIR